MVVGFLYRPAGFSTALGSDATSQKQQNILQRAGHARHANGARQAWTDPETRQLVASSQNGGTNLHLPAESLSPYTEPAPGDRSPDSSQPAAPVRTSPLRPLPSKTPPGPRTSPGSLATTAVSSPERTHHTPLGLRPRESEPSTMPFLVVLGRFAAFTVSVTLGSQL